MDLAARIQTGSSQVRRDDVIDFQGVGVVSRAADPIVRMESSEQCKPLSKTDNLELSVVISWGAEYAKIGLIGRRTNDE
jgi:hypothetical protein